MAERKGFTSCSCPRLYRGASGSTNRSWRFVEPSLGLTLNTLSRRAPSAVITTRVVAPPIQLEVTLGSDYNNKVYS
jgi:hypothetical protein